MAAGYDMYFGKTLFPVTPDAITTKVNGKNKIHDLINDAEMNVLKAPGLTTITMTVLLPSAKYPFAVYKNGFKKPSYYLDIMAEYMTKKKPFQFIVSRRETGTVRKNLYNTNLTVSLENFTVRESAKDAGTDILVDIELKQFIQYKTKTFKVEQETPPVVEQERQETTTEEPESTGTGGGGKKGQKYKVQIPGMAVVEVWATSVQEAITKAAGTWTGTIYVDGTTYTVEKGVIKKKTMAEKAKELWEKVTETVKKAAEEAKKKKKTIVPKDEQTYQKM